MFLRNAVPVLLAVFISVPTTLIINRLVSPPPLMLSVNLKQMVQDYSRHLARQSLSEAETTAKITAFTQAVDKTLARYSQENNAVILTQGAVIFGAINIDNAIKRAIKQQLNEQTTDAF
ncbi:TrbI F-type domain-containing protein [Photobacterium damselae]|uniref:TrbI F-type domain-containing protein n=1 Tax=Photobacterium damselae TaxID=38293 RepID=UPI0012FE787C|nr:TrbI F-type domain-containing protein [Photobacterium damselae]